jgi:hypothetical protein
VNLDPFLLWIENTALSRWLVESPSLLAFPTVLILHAIGMGFAAGIAVAFDLRVLGVAPHVPFAAMRRLFTVLWAGLLAERGVRPAAVVGVPDQGAHQSGLLSQARADRRRHGAGGAHEP